MLDLVLCQFVVKICMSMTNLQNLAVWSTKIQSEARLVGRCRQRGCVFGWKSIISSLPRGLCCVIYVVIHFHDDFTNPN